MKSPKSLEYLRAYFKNLKGVAGKGGYKAAGKKFVSDYSRNLRGADIGAQEADLSMMLQDLSGTHRSMDTLAKKNAKLTALLDAIRETPGQMTELSKNWPSAPIAAGTGKPPKEVFPMDVEKLNTIKRNLAESQLLFDNKRQSLDIQNAKIGEAKARLKEFRIKNKIAQGGAYAASLGTAGAGIYAGNEMLKESSQFANLNRMGNSLTKGLGDRLTKRLNTTLGTGKASTNPANVQPLDPRVPAASKTMQNPGTIKGNLGLKPKNFKSTI